MDGLQNGKEDTIIDPAVASPRPDKTPTMSIDGDSRKNTEGDSDSGSQESKNWKRKRAKSTSPAQMANPLANGAVQPGGSTTSSGATTKDFNRKSGQFFLPPDQALGMVFEHSQEGPSGVDNNRTSLVNVFEGADVAAALSGWSGETSPARHQDKDRERVLKLSPAKIHQLTSSPQSIPYRAVPEEWDQGRKLVLDGAHNTTSVDSHTQSLDEMGISLDTINKLQSGRDVPSDGAFVSMTSIASRHHSVSSAPNRPQPSRTVSTPTSSRRQTLPVINERMTQTRASRSKGDRPGIGRLEQEPKHQLSPSPQIEPALPSPMPQSNIPLPPLSVPTYLQLELASGRPSPLYIHRSATADFPYESSRAKLERLANFLMLPPALEQVLFFGILACLDSWLYSFTILPLRFLKAVYILLESWVINLGFEFRFISGFIFNGVGRVWWRWTRKRAVSGKQETTPVEQETRSKAAEQRRRYKHRRQRSIPSALLPDDKADILKGLLMIATCCALMCFDASRMYHWIRGQAAIKLYVIYNVLEVGDRLFAAIGQDVLECLFSREALERRPDGRSKIFRPFGLFLLALAYTVIHSMALFYQVMTLNVAVNSYSNALITLLLSNQFVEIKSTVFKKFEKENLFQLTCADVVERFQLWLMLTIIASRNIVETGAFNLFGDLGSSFSSLSSTNTNSTPLTTPPRTSSSILPQSFTFFPSSLISSFSHVNFFLPTLAQVLGPFLIVMGSEMLVDWVKHAYVGKFNNTRPALYGRFLDVLAKDYYNNAFSDQNLNRRLGLPVIPLSCLFFRVSVQTYQMFLAALVPHQPSSTTVETTSLASIRSHYIPSPMPSAPPLTFETIIPTSAAYASAFFRRLLDNTIPSPAQSVHIFTVVLVLAGYILLLILKLLLGMLLLTFARSRYRALKNRESKQLGQGSNGVAESNGTGKAAASRGREFTVEGSRRVGGWGVVEVNDDKRRWIYADDPEALRRLKAKEEKDKSAKGEELSMDHVNRYDMVAKRIW